MSDYLTTACAVLVNLILDSFHIAQPNSRNLKRLHTAFDVKNFSTRPITCAKFYAFYVWYMIPGTCVYYFAPLADPGYSEGCCTCCQALALSARTVSAASLFVYATIFSSYGPNIFIKVSVCPPLADPGYAKGWCNGASRVLSAIAWHQVHVRPQPPFLFLFLYEQNILVPIFFIKPN